MLSKNKNLKFFVTFLLLFILAYSARAYVASSTHYRLQFDSLNVGGTRQTSTNYISEDTIGEIATGLSESTLYKLKAGYQQMNEVYIAIGLADDTVFLTPAIGGITGGIGNGLTIATTTTDNPAGYLASIKASTTPALKSGSYSFADYTLPPGTTSPEFNWSIDSNTSEFGYTVEGIDIVQFFKDTGGPNNLCNAGLNDNIEKCWLNLTTSNQNIAGSSTANHPSGTATTIRFRAESGTNHIQEEGIYTATIYLTAVAL